MNIWLQEGLDLMILKNTDTFSSSYVSCKKGSWQLL